MMNAGVRGGTGRWADGFRAPKTGFPVSYLLPCNIVVFSRSASALGVWLALANGMLTNIMKLEAWEKINASMLPFSLLLWDGHGGVPRPTWDHARAGQLWPQLDTDSGVSQQRSEWSWLPVDLWARRNLCCSKPLRGMVAYFTALL